MTGALPELDATPMNENPGCVFVDRTLAATMTNGRQIRHGQLRPLARSRLMGDPIGHIIAKRLEIS